MWTSMDIYYEWKIKGKENTSKKVEISLKIEDNKEYQIWFDIVEKSVIKSYEKYEMGAQNRETKRMIWRHHRSIS